MEAAQEESNLRSGASARTPSELRAGTQKIVAPPTAQLTAEARQRAVDVR
jgi:hypothetical protein